MVMSIVPRRARSVTPGGIASSKWKSPGARVTHQILPTSISRKPSARGVTVGVIGSTRDNAARHLLLAFELGRAIGIAGCTLVTGACHGMPLEAAKGAQHEGALVVGVSPGLSLAEHTTRYDSPADHHDILVFTGSGLMGREIINMRTSEVVVVAGGHAGTLGELAIAYVEGKIIGVLTGVGGVSKIIRQVLRVCHKESGARVLYDKSPHRLVSRMMNAYWARGGVAKRQLEKNSQRRPANVTTPPDYRFLTLSRTAPLPTRVR